MSQLERIYFFHQKLKNNRFPNARTLQEEFELSRATAHRDINSLRDRLLAPLAFDSTQNENMLQEQQQNWYDASIGIKSRP